MIKPLWKLPSSLPLCANFTLHSYLRASKTNCPTTELAEDRTHVLEVDGIDWFIRENGTTCHTSGYELVRERKAAVVRRGDAFTLGVSCKNRAYDPNRDKIRFIFEFGECLGVCREEEGWRTYLFQGVYYSWSFCNPASL